MSLRVRSLERVAQASQRQFKQDGAGEGALVVKKPSYFAALKSKSFKVVSYEADKNQKE